ncbi:TIGR03943 family protein [Sutcliffiella horikoshii]|uniref:TIGR03943 family protein n=1 Tax=Sutcliffiella horikoshii TaxID=79883 RepID=A0A5D4S781_9BACI|nr:TIGR03943 family protein [Sutcliffiella horikoshii]TYS59543.1 TIGR03943 family protein [Sutcliffiella horikoshii]
MYFHFQQAIKAVVLLLFSGLLFMLHHTGDIYQFINPQYKELSQIASIIFLILFFIQVPRIFISRELAQDHVYCSILGCNHEIGNPRKLPFKNIVIYFIVILPLVLGFLLPHKGLGAAEAKKRGVIYAASHETEHDHGSHLDESATLFTNTINEMLKSSVLVLDHSNYSSYINNIITYPEVFNGKSIELEGFILLDVLNTVDSPVLARFIVTHCVADAHVKGLLLDSDDDNLRNVDDWVKLKGKITLTEHNGQTLPMVHVYEWVPIVKPIVPYIYP